MRTFFPKAIVLAGILCLACTTKVSEWVLLNATPNQYTLVFFHKNAPAERVKAENELLVKTLRDANITFRDVAKDDAVQPFYALYYGNRLFSRHDSPEQLNGLVTSPAREK